MRSLSWRSSHNVRRAAHWAVMCLACAPFAVAAWAQEASAPPAAFTDAARGAARELGETLKGQLVAALKSGGPTAAISVCNTAAPAIAASVSQKQNLSVRRTALKVRNASNAPDAFERRVLEDFARQIAGGADPAKLEHAETVSENGMATWRYMKAIPMAAEPCAACHGAQLAPEVKDAVAKLYPHDEATGFKPGELRGAFSITQAAK